MLSQLSRGLAISFFLKIKIIYLATPGLSFGVFNLCCGMLDLLLWACGIYFSDQGWDLGPLCWEHRVLATGTAWKFQDWAFPPAFGVVKVEALVAQSCLTLCSPMAYSPPGSFIRRSLQARILEWVAMSFSRGSSHSGDRTWVSCFAGRVFTV